MIEFVRGCSSKEGAALPILRPNVKGQPGARIKLRTGAKHRTGAKPRTGAKLKTAAGARAKLRIRAKLRVTVGTRAKPRTKPRTRVGTRAELRTKATAMKSRRMTATSRQAGEIRCISILAAVRTPKPSNLNPAHQA